MNSSTPVVLVTADDYLLRHWQAAAIPHPTIRAGLDWQAQDGSIVLVDATMAGLPDWHDPWWREKTAVYRIIIADTTPDDAEAFAALQAGCFGYCQAAAPLEMLRQVLEVVSEGGLWARSGDWCNDCSAQSTSYPLASRGRTCSNPCPLVNAKSSIWPRAGWSTS